MLDCAQICFEDGFFTIRDVVKYIYRQEIDEVFYVHPDDTVQDISESYEYYTDFVRHNLTIAELNEAEAILDSWNDYGLSL